LSRSPVTVLDRDRIAPLRGGLQVVDRATEVATVSLRDPFERVRLELDPLLRQMSRRTGTMERAETSRNSISCVAFRSPRAMS